MKSSPCSRSQLRIRICLAALVVVALALPLAARAATIRQEAYLKDFDPRQYDAFGSSVAVSGDTLVIGARGEYGDGHGPLYAGAAYVFVRNGTDWILEASLKAANGYTHDWFGHTVAISGDTVVVGAFWEDSNATGVNRDQSDNSAPRSGAAYVFVRSGTNWTQQAYLKASNAEGAEPHPDGGWFGGDVFGYSVVVSGDTVVVGAPEEESSATGVNGDQSDNSAPRSGAAYVFVRSGTNWSQQAYLKASNAEGAGPTSPDGGDNFGWSLAVSGDTVVVGAPGEESNATEVNGDQSDNSAPRCGAAYVFVRSGTNWTQQAYLKASDASSSDIFGWSVAVSGNTVVVGAPYASTTRDDDSGAAYVFARDGTNWTQQARFEDVNAVRDDYFGWSVALSDNTAVVGAPYATTSAAESGRACFFVRSGTNWSPQVDLKPSTNSYQSSFGGSVAVAGDTIVVGAPGDNDIIRLSGVAYVFTMAAPPPPLCDGFCITSFKVEANLVTITWRSQPGETYYVGFKAALTDPNWTPVSGGIIAQATEASWTGLRAPDATGFYCVVKVDG
jgi:hypothetical protein